MSDEAESRVDRALRLQAEHLAAREAVREAVEDLSDAELREFLERVKR